MNTTSEKIELKMTDGDQQADLAKASPALKIPKPLFGTTSRILPAARRIVAVSGRALADNVNIYTTSRQRPVVEIWEITTEGDYEKYDARFLMNVRHVEILGPSWVFHDPHDRLNGSDKRTAVMETSSPLRVYEDTEGQKEHMEQPEPFERPRGC